MKPQVRSALSWLLALLFSVAVIVYTIYKIDWHTIQSTLTKAHWGWMGLGLLVYFLNYILRAWRMQMLILPQGVSFLNLVAVNGLYGMYNYLLPAKSGEASYVLLVNRRLMQSLAEGTAMLLVQRYLDLVTIALILPAVLFFYLDNMPAWLINASIWFCVLVLLGSAGLYWFVRPGAAPADRLLPAGNRWLARIGKVLRELQNGIIAIYERRQMVQLLLVTMAIWICINTMFYLVVLSLGFRLSYFQIVVISIIMIPMTLLPFQGFANLGTHEIGWVAAFSIFGQPENIALTIAFNSHIIVLCYVLVLGAVSFLITMLLDRSHPLSEHSARG